MPAADAAVVLNEIHYHPNSADGMEEFLEFVNRGAATVDLSGWRLSDGVAFTFPANTQLTAGGYLVVAASPERLLAATGHAAALGPWEGRLSNGGERIALTDAGGGLVDEVTYADGGQWDAAADGDGPALELIHPQLPNQYGEAWRASAAANGTPGAINSAYQDDPPALLVEVRHAPAVPLPESSVTVTCRSYDESGAPPLVFLWYRRDGASAYQQVLMADDGQHGDGAAGDSVYGASVPGLLDGERLDFRFVARDASGQISSSPTTSAKTHLCPFLADPPTGDFPTYYLELTAANRQELETRYLFSDVLLDSTFLHENGGVYYNTGVRYRGTGSRWVNPKSYRIEFAKDNPLDRTTTSLNLNGREPQRQYLGYDLFRRAGHAYPLAAFVRFRLNESPPLLYIRVESVDDDFLERVYPTDSSGNLYRGIQDGDLSYLGDDPEAYRPHYEKRTNEEEDDWSDLIRLADVLHNTPDEAYPAAVESVLDPANWMRYFAVNALLNNQEGGIYRDTGDDYYLYVHENDGRARLLPWDTDSVLTGEQETLWRARVPAVKRLLRHNAFAPRFVRQVRDLLDSAFSPTVMAARIASLGPASGPVFNQQLNDFVAARHAFLRNEIKDALTLYPCDAGHELPLVRHEENWRYAKGTAEPSGGTRNWTRTDFADGGWLVGPGGFGYGDGDAGTALEDMRGNYLSLYLRRTFSYADPGVSSNYRVRLRVDYDDAFVAYLNGVEVARRNIGDIGEFAPFNRPADGFRDAGEPEIIDLGTVGYLLRAGDNVLALQGHNNDLQSSDFTLTADLYVVDPAAVAACEVLYSHDHTLRLYGSVDQAATFAVEVNGQPADYTAYLGLWSCTLLLQPGPNPVVIRALGQHGEEVGRLERTIVYTGTTTALRLTLPPRVVRGKVLTLLAETVDAEGAVDWRVRRGVATLTITRHGTGEPVPASPATFAMVRGAGTARTGFDVTGSVDVRVSVGMLSAVKTVEIIETQVRSLAGTLGGNDLDWGPEDGFVRLVSNTTVPAGEVLTIRPGTLVGLDPGVRLEVQGSVEAIGTADEPIHVFPAVPGAPWAQIDHFASPSASRYEYVFLVGGADTPTVGHCCGPAVRARGGSLALTRCVSIHPAGQGLFSDDAEVLLSACVFSGNSLGAEMFGPTLTVEDCWFIDTLSGGDDQDALYLNRQGNHLVTRSIFSGGGDDGIDTYFNSARIANCIIEGFADKGISLRGGNPTIENCLIVDCARGFSVKDTGPTTVTPRLSHVTLAGHEIAGFVVENRDGTGDNADIRPLLDEVIVWDAPVSILTDYAPGDITVTYSDVEHPIPTSGWGNLSEDPLFVDADRGDYRLDAASPARTAGADGGPIGWLGFRGGSDPAGWVWGDLSGDGRAGTVDAALILQWDAFLVASFPAYPDVQRPAYPDAGDVSGDGRLGTVDAAELLQLDAFLRNCLSADTDCDGLGPEGR